ncbi:MAG: S-adenosyl-l-methionine hydroxide adenosyltransferase family protein [Phycisphaerae bacterium]
MRIVTLTTDYGSRDHYAGVMKGVMLSIAPRVTLVDITHEVEPQNVLHAAFVLRRIWQWYPPGTIHLAVVDPGVGSERRILVGRYDGRYVVAPDNGLVTLVHRDLPAEALRYVESTRYVLRKRSATFHGRDIMAPVAAHLASGVQICEFGPPAANVELLAVEHLARSTGGAIHGRVLHVDRFGTLITNITEAQLAAGPDKHRSVEVFVNGTAVGPLRSTFCDVPTETPLALVGGSGMLEIAVNCGNAAELFGPADSVLIEVR